MHMSLRCGAGGVVGGHRPSPLLMHMPVRCGGAGPTGDIPRPPCPSGVVIGGLLGDNPPPPPAQMHLKRCANACKPSIVKDTADVYEVWTDCAGFISQARTRLVLKTSSVRRPPMPFLSGMCISRGAGHVP